MTIFRTFLTSALASAGLCAALVATAAPAEARHGSGAAIAAGFLGATALGIATAHAYDPRPVRVSKRYSHRCGCMVQKVRSYD